MSSDKYIHSDVENSIYTYWEKNKLFKPRKNKKAKPLLSFGPQSEIFWAPTTNRSPRPGQDSTD